MLWDKRKKRKQTKEVVRKKLTYRVWEEKYEMHYKEFKENNSECFHYGKKMLTTKGKNILKLTWLYVYANH